MNKLSVEEINLFDEEYREEFKEYQKNLEEDLDEFVEEVIIIDSDWVADRKIEYLENQFNKIEYEIQWWDMLSRIYGGWFRQVIREVLAKPMRKEQTKIKREMDLYRKPVAINYDKPITESDIQQANNIDCAEILKATKKVGRNKLALCLFHDDSRPSLHLYPDHYHCYSCGAHGTAVNLVMKLHNLTFIEAVRFLINKW